MKRKKKVDCSCIEKHERFFFVLKIEFFAKVPQTSHRRFKSLPSNISHLTLKKFLGTMRDNDEEEEGNGLFTLKRASFGMYYFVASSIAIALLCDFAYVVFTFINRVPPKHKTKQVLRDGGWLRRSRDSELS